MSLYIYIYNIYIYIYNIYIYIYKWCPSFCCSCAFLPNWPVRPKSSEVETALPAGLHGGMEPWNPAFWEYPLTNIAMEITISTGKTPYKWAIFHSYVKLLEGSVHLWNLSRTAQPAHSEYSEPSQS